MKNNKIYDSVLELVGNTPMIRLNKICAGLSSEILAKLEYLNPSGSLKDRIAIEMIDGAEKEGKIKPGYTLIESSTGNTGFALSTIGRLKGYNVTIYETMPGKAGSEKKKMMENVGAEVRLMEPKDIEGIKERSIAGSEVELPGRQLCLDDEKAHPDKIWWARQFSNEYNVKAHYITAKEILEQTDGKIDIFVQSIGTGGSLVGIAQVLKKEIPNLKVIGIQPASSKELWHPGMDFPNTEIKGGIVAKMLKMEGIVDTLVRTTDSEARNMTHRLWKEEGLYCGVSSGANVHYALEEIKKSNGKKTVVTLLNDHMNRYLTEERYVT
ncbi:cysteine synthase family protein [Candidatus Dependentiae bacterium]|nr:cysteine synthase family protein [Candidatus Dependentiae bacterium]